MERGAATLVVGALSLVFALLTVAEFPLLEEVAPSVFEAIDPKETDRLDEFNTPSFTLYLDLRAVASGATITITDPDLLTEAGEQRWADKDLVPALERSELIGIATLDEVVLAPPPELDPAALARITQAQVATGEFRDLGPYAVSVAPGEVEEIVAVQHDGVVLLVDRRLLGAGA